MINMNKKVLALFLICVISLLISFLFSFFYPSINLFGEYPLTILTILFFIFGFLGFGLIAFIPHIILGISFGTMKNGLIMAYFPPLLLASYAGIKFGILLLDDFNKKKYFLSEIKPIIMMILIAIILALVIEVSLPIVLNESFWPTNFFGFSFDQNVGSSYSAFDELVNLR
jgi:hypothetical protein